MTQADEPGAVARLQRLERISDDLRGATERIVAVLHQRGPEQRDLPRTLAKIASISADVLPVSATRLWLFDKSARLLRCRAAAPEAVSPCAPEGVPEADCRDFLKALDGQPALVLDSARDDARLATFPCYAGQSTLSHLLCIAVAVPGELRGALCFEQHESDRPLERPELDFAAHVGHLLALALEAERRYQAERKADGTEARYRYLVESLPVSVYSFDAFSDVLQYVSPQVSELGPFDAETLLARGVSAWLEYVHEEDRAKVEARFEQGGIESSPDELVYRLCLPDGSTRHVRDRARVVRDPLGNPLAIQGVVADITGQRQAELLTLELQRRYHTLLEHVDLIALVLDRDGCVEFVNECFERTTGYKREQVMGLDAFGLMVPSSELDATRGRFLRDVRAQTIVPRFEHEIRTREGEARRVVWTNTLLRSVNGESLGTCSLGLDVTERSKLESELMQQTKLEGLGRLSAGVAHDFNNLLTVMMVQSEVLAAELKADKKEKALETLNSALKQAAGLTHSLLVYARKEPIHPAPVELDALVQETLPLASTMTRQGVSLESELKAAGLSVVIDPVQIRQLLLNLTRNAVDATQAGGGHVRLSTSRVEVSDAEARGHGGSCGGDFAMLRVVDDGEGMDELSLRRAFEPFYTTKDVGKGTGLGLAMCQSIANRAGGFMTLSSTLGEGTDCRVYLPLQGPRQRATRPSASRRSTRPGAYALAPARVLVAEHDARMRDLIAQTLQELSLDVTAVATADVAARIMATAPVDLLITEDQLPDASGFVLARSARAARPHMRVALLTADATEGAEFDAMLSKPLTSAALREAMITLLPQLAGSR